MTKYTFDSDIVSDLHKDAHGFRPRENFWEFWTSATDDEKQAEWDALLQALERSIARDKEEQTRSVAAFEQLVADTIASGAGDVATAHRWIMEASICDGDWDFLCYEYGLPYLYFKKVA